jgi:hypothetical protein
MVTGSTRSKVLRFSEETIQKDLFLELWLNCTPDICSARQGIYVSGNIVILAFTSMPRHLRKYLDVMIMPRQNRKFVLLAFELCRRTQQPSLTFCLVGGSTFGLWPLFHLRDGGKWTEMTATQHGGTLRL